ncbi:cytosolic phospholipase A2 gamma-like isoform X2 [Channa argus]|uniref:cytosolic phospholipase A2 gamma-like isoform X2 n=1 Tax=Channa argus TaxID=215402 RepID=UPI003520316A
MQTGKASLSVFLFCLCLGASGTLVKAVDGMEEKEAGSEKHIRQSQSLCTGEQDYVNRRKQAILESLSSLEMNCTLDDVPHIALLGSGGGQRAAIGLVGSLYQLEKDSLLDTLLYLGGVSGSTWSMTSVYSDPEWSTNMDTAVSRLLGHAVNLEEALAWLSDRAKEEDFSLSDIWGVLTSAGIMKHMDPRHFSDEASRNSTNPYPIYGAIEKFCFTNGPVEGKWFEVSPHEAGFTEMGLFVQTSLLGSKFQNGELLEQKSEMDMVRLQVPGLVDSGAKEFLRLYNILDKLVDLTRSTINDPTALSDLDNLQKILKDTVNANKSALLESKTPEQWKHFFQQWNLELLSAVETWSQSPEDEAFKTHVSLLTKQVLPLILKWEWGTTRNFLYQYQGSTVPPCLSSKENFHLVDAGMLINVAYPSFLGDKRDIDLIIAPEYSAGNMFETLTLARDYAAQVKKPFPEIDNKILEDRDWPKDCYVIEGKGKEPTIVFMPLFNRNNCKDADEFKAKMEEFSTFQRPFSLEKIQFVLETAKANIKNNKETLLREINKAILHRQNKRKSMQHQIFESCVFGLL